jgi:hypothetical protein
MSGTRSARSHVVNYATAWHETAAGEAEGYDSWSRVDLLLAGGISIPVAPGIFKDEWDPQFTAAAGLAFYESPRFAIVLNGSFSKFNRAHNRDVSSIYLSAGARGYLRTVATPYLEGGVGFFHLGGTNVEENALGAHALAGAQYSLLFAEAAYVLGFTTEDHTGYVSVRAGLAIQVGGKH